MKKIKLLLEVEVRAENREHAEDMMNDIMQTAWYYGLGVEQCTDAADPEVPRIYDWDVLIED